MTSEDKFKELLGEKLEGKDVPFDQRHWQNMANLIDRSREKKSRTLWLWLLLLSSLSGSVAVYLLKTPAASQLAQHPVVPTGPESPAASLAPAAHTTDAQRANTPHKPSALHPSGASASPHFNHGPSVHRVVTAPAVGGSAGEAHTNNKLPEPSAETAAAIHTSAQTLPAPEQTPPELASELPSEENPVQPLMDSTRLAGDTSIPGLPSVAPLQSDSASGVANAPAIVPPENPGVIRHFLFAEAGLNYLTGWKAGDSYDGRGANFTAGLVYLYQLTRQLGISGGLGYTTVGHLGAWQHVSKTTSYSFGERNDLTVITPSRMHYLQVPVKLNYQLNPRFVVGAGYTFGYLAAVSSEIKTFGEGYAYSPASATAKSRLYQDGFNKFDSQIAVFCRHRVYGEWWLNAELLLGLSDSRRNAFFGNPVAERNSGLKLSVIYKIAQH